MIRHKSDPVETITMNAKSKWYVMTALVLLPLTMGATCSANAVAQSAATTAANVTLTNLINAFFNALTGAN